jgi:hypothetical protein
VSAPRYIARNHAEAEHVRRLADDPEDGFCEEQRTLWPARPYGWLRRLAWSLVWLLVFGALVCTVKGW